MSDLGKRLLTAKDFLKDPSILDPYPHKYVLLLDQSTLSVSHKNLLTAIEQMEEQGWVLHSVTYSGNARGMYALMSRMQ
jgi:hypothetical protein